MASLTKKPTSKNWVAVITLSDGRRTNRSTGTTDRKEAQRIANAFQDRERDGREKRLTELAIRRTLNDILKRNTGETLNSETTKEFLENWLNGKQNEHTRERYAVVVSGFLASLGSKANSFLSHVTYKDVQKYLDQRREEKVASKTLSVEAKALSAAFNLARRLHIIEENPVGKALALKPITVVSLTRTPFSPDEFPKLLEKADLEWKAVILFGIYTGARLGDCATMTWQNIDFKDRLISYVDTKEDSQIILPMHDSLESLLRHMYKNSSGEGFITPSLATKQTSGKSGLSATFLNLMEAAGIDPQRVEGRGKRSFARKTFHALRHSCNSILANEGVSKEKRMQMIGHVTEAINSKYTHFELKTLREDIQKLPNIDVNF